MRLPTLRRSARLAGFPPSPLPGRGGVGGTVSATAAPISHPLAADERQQLPPPPPPPQPTAAEVAAAEAARARLYGEGGGVQAMAAEQPPAPALPTGPPPPAVEVPLLATADLPPLEGDLPAVMATLSRAASDLASADWATVARAAEVVRRGAAHQPAATIAALPAALPALAKAVSSMRSALSRHALTAAADLVSTYGQSHPWVFVGGGGEEVAGPSAAGAGPGTITTTPPPPSLLQAVLAKAASTDKRFVVEAAAAVLNRAADAGGLPSPVLAAALLPFTGDKSPRVRATAGGVLVRAAGRAGDAHPWPATASAAALSSAAALVGDTWPPARAAGQSLRDALRCRWTSDREGGQSKENRQVEVECGEGKGAAWPPAATSWAAHCVAILGERGAAALGCV